MIESRDITAIGKFQKTHALKGELNALLDIDPGYVEDGNALIMDVDGIYVPFFATGVRPKGTNSYLVKLDGIDSEEEARQFVNKEIYAVKKNVADYLDLDEDEIADEDELIGYMIIDEETGKEIGEIEDIDDSTQNLLFVVKSEDGEVIFIPAVDEFIMEIDEDRKVIIMNLPAGLLDLNIKNV